MPTYEYRCTNGHGFEDFVLKMSDAKSVLPCPNCGERGERHMSAGGGLVFKGSGFYITDYGKDGKKSQAPAKGEASSSEGSKSEGAKAEGAKAEGGRSEGAKGEGGKSEGAKAEAPKGDGAKAEGAKPAAAKAEGTSGKSAPTKSGGE